MYPVENIFNWHVSKLEKTQKFAAFVDVVSVIHWRRIIDSNGKRSSRYATLICPPPDRSNFIPFNELTDEIIFSWLDNFIDFNIIDQELIQEILPGEIQE